MTILVTGATGFLGRQVVRNLTERGHRVRALVRRPADFGCGMVETYEADLRRRKGLDEALSSVDTVVHLAAAVVGDDESRFKNAVNATENLLDAMQSQAVKRIVHISSFSVYDWSERRPVLDETTGLEPNVYGRDSYAVAKLWQEKVVCRAAEHGKWAATILRPGFLWGPNHVELGGIGQRVGPIHFVVAGSRPLPLSFVDNCADCIGHATDQLDEGLRYYNVLDNEDISAWRYANVVDQVLQRRSLRIYTPYWCGLLACKLSRLTSDLCFGKQGKLPSILVTQRYRARFRPLRFAREKLHHELGWKSPLTFQQSVSATLESESQALNSTPQKELSIA